MEQEHPATGGTLWTLRGHRDSVWCCKWVDEGCNECGGGGDREGAGAHAPLLLSGSADATVRVWSAGACLSVFGEAEGGHSDSVFSIVQLPNASSADGAALIASGGWDGELMLSRLALHGPARGQLAHVARARRPATGSSPQGTAPAHADAVWRLGYQKAAARLISGGWDGRVAAWDSELRLCSDVSLSPTGACAVVDVSMSVHGDEAIVLSRSGAIVAWDGRGPRVECALQRLAEGGGSETGAGVTAALVGRECTRIACVGGAGRAARMLVTGHESGQCLLWDRRQSRSPVCELSPAGVAPSRGAGSGAKTTVNPSVRLRRVDCGDRTNRAVVALAWDVRAPWQIFSGHFDGAIQHFDFGVGMVADVSSN
eukprot:g379.t1